MEAVHAVNTRADAQWLSTKESGKTNVSDVKLAITTAHATSHATSIAASAASAAPITTLHSTTKATAASGRSDETWFRLSVLFPSSARYQMSSSFGEVLLRVHRRAGPLSFGC